MQRSSKAEGVVGNHPSASEAVRADIEEAILSGRLPAGGRVNADDVARRMGVSHIPVREALRALQADGWIVHRPNKGAFVRDRDPRDLADLFEARLQLECAVAVLAAQRRTVRQLDGLDEILARQVASADPGELAELNAEFHVLLARCSQNTVLTEYLRNLSKRVRFYYLPAATPRRSTSLAEHRAIVDSLRWRNAERAHALVQAHISDTWAEAVGTLTHTSPTER